MAMEGRTVIATDTSDLMRLSQWLSPSFPVSAYAYSHGLEAEIVGGRVTDSAGLEAWLTHVLRAGTGRSDAILLRAARHQDADFVSDFALALASSAERVEEMMAQGRAFAETRQAMGQGDGVARPLPVAVGVACRDLWLDDGTVVSLYLQAFIGNLVAAAVRFIPLGQADGQACLARLHPVIRPVVAETESADLDDIGQSMFGADLAAMEHETLETRLFRS
ncbi:MAG: urease accessory UreF family protein [Pseudomonadota bacterium]